MQIGSTLRIEKETDEKAIAGFAGMDVQPFFRSKSFPDLDHSKLSEWLKKHEVNVVSLHYPSCRGFLPANLEMLMDTYQTRLFTVHPFGNNLEHFFRLFSLYKHRIDRLGVELAFENMPFSDAWNGIPEEMLKITQEFEFAFLTFDTTHLPKGYDAIDGFERCKDKIKIIHLSNVFYGAKRRDHRPFLDGERDLQVFLDYLKRSEANPQIILEYAFHSPDVYKHDIAKVKYLVGDSNKWPKLQKASMSLDDCINVAKEAVSQRGYCILAYDVVGSESLSALHGQSFWKRWRAMNNELTYQFKHYLGICPGFDRNTKWLRDYFDIWRGDGASACVISAQGVEDIIRYQKQTYPDIPLRFVVGKKYNDLILKLI